VRIWCSDRKTGLGLRAHLDGRDDGLVTVAPLLDRLGSVTALIDIEPEAVALARLRAAETTGRPLGSGGFVTRLEEPDATPFATTEAGAESRGAGERRRPLCRNEREVGATR